MKGGRVVEAWKRTATFTVGNAADTPSPWPNVWCPPAKGSAERNMKQIDDLNRRGAAVGSSLRGENVKYLPLNRYVACPGKIYRQSVHRLRHILSQPAPEGDQGRLPPSCDQQNESPDFQILRLRQRGTWRKSCLC
jgi:hypothetical protein